MSDTAIKLPLANQGVDEVDCAITKAHSESRGWAIGEYLSGTPFNQHKFYVVDYRTQGIYLLGITAKEFDSVPKNEMFSMPQLATAITSVVADAANHLCRVDGFAGALSAYVKRSKSYEMWRNSQGPGALMHVIVNIYGTQSGESTVRIFFVSGDATFVEPEKVARYSEQVHGMDREKHPEWFL